jgi:hypothetical protein
VRPPGMRKKKQRERKRERERERGGASRNGMMASVAAAAAVGGKNKRITCTYILCRASGLPFATEL